MELTKEFIIAVEGGASAIREKAQEASNLPEAKSSGKTGELIRKRAEECHQTADMLDGWAIRARTELKMEPKG